MLPLKRHILAKAVMQISTVANFAKKMLTCTSQGWQHAVAVLAVILFLYAPFLYASFTRADKIQGTSECCLWPTPNIMWVRYFEGTLS